ncbi:transmembrane protein 169 [Argonauta hians]
MASDYPDCVKGTELEEINEKEWIELPESSPEDQLQQNGCPGVSGGYHSGERHFVTMTGTVARGYQAGQIVDVQLQISRDELRKLTLERGSNEDKMKYKLSPVYSCGLHSGLHVILFTILCVPFAWMASLGYSFYIGCNTWYNIYLYFSEEKTIWHKISICPVLILTFPFTVGLSSLSLSFYASMIQISWDFFRWFIEFQDYEKGFYGWFCNWVNLNQCSPYEVVILDCPDTIRETKLPPS